MKKTLLAFALLIGIFLFAGLGLEQIFPAGVVAASAQDAALPLLDVPAAPAAEARTLSLADAPLPAQAVVIAVFLLFGVLAVSPIFVDRPQNRGQ